MGNKQSDPDRETNYSRQVVFEFMCSENEKGRLGEMGARGTREMVNVSYGCKYTVKKRTHEDGCRDSQQDHGHYMVLVLQELFC